MVSVCLPSDALLQHLPSYLGFSYLGRGVSLHGRSSKAQPLLLTLDEGYLLSRRSWPSTWDSSSRPSCACTATASGVAPPGRRPWPRAWVAPPRCRPWPRAWGGSSASPPLASGARWLLLASPTATDHGRGVAPLGHHPDLGRGVSPPGQLDSFVAFWWVLSRSVVSDSLRPRELSLPDSSVHGILQARILEWVAISYSRGSSRSRDWTRVSCVSCIAGEFIACWAIPEALLLYANTNVTI